MKLLRTALVSALALATTACFQSTTVVKLKADGTGTINQRLVFTAAAIEQMKQLAGATGNGGAAAFDPLSDDTAKEMAGGLGPGVRFVSSTPVKTADGEGRDMVFAFDDIRALQVSQQPPGADALASGGDNLKFALTRTGANALLTITMPGVSSLTSAVGGGAGGGGAPPLAQLAMLKTLLAGARVTIAVEPVGRLVHTNSAYVDGNRVTLIELQLDALFADPTLFTKLAAAPDTAAAEALLKGVPGLKVPSQPEITIEFAP